MMFSLLSMICSAGCNSITLYPLDKKHIIDINKGETITAPIDGYFLSDDYFKKVLKAEVKEF